MNSTPVFLSGFGGFLGYHTRIAAKALSIPVFELDLRRETALPAEGPFRIIHLAGISRGTDHDVSDGNIKLATLLVSAAEKAGGDLLSITYANSTQSGMANPYGYGKAKAGEVLSSFAQKVGARFDNFLLPHVFGEHGKAGYNMVTSTFCDAVVHGLKPSVIDDKELSLLHAQDVADILLGAGDLESAQSDIPPLTVSELLSLISHMWDTYASNGVPDFRSRLHRNLWNTLISHIPPADRTFEISGNTDSRGTFSEVLRVPSSSLQVSVSDTLPGQVRGNHFHRRKFERFIVLEGKGRIELWQAEKRMNHEYIVEGNKPCWIDMPTGWSHSIQNIGDSLMKTLFISDSVFDPEDPDTFLEVRQERDSQ